MSDPNALDRCEVQVVGKSGSAIGEAMRDAGTSRGPAPDDGNPGISLASGPPKGQRQPRTIQSIGNPILLARAAGRKETSLVADAAAIAVPTAFASRRSWKRNLHVLFRKQSAREAITDFAQEIDVFGLTKGQFSLIELIEAVLEKTGPASLTVSTWTAARTDVSAVLDFIRAGKVTDARFLLDFTFQRRAPAVAQAIRDTFGPDALRVTRNHAKFFQLGNARGWTVTCKTSMNLNQNPRLEDFNLSNHSALYAFLQTVVDDLFRQTGKRDQAGMTTNQLQRQFLALEEDE